MTKKLFPLISIILIAAFALAACAQPTATEAPAAPAATQAPAAPAATEAPAAPAATEAPAAPAATEAPAAPAGGGEVYYLNFKPEVAELYQKIGEAYKQETGVTLKVVTAASGTYEQTLKSEIAKSDAQVGS